MANKRLDYDKLYKTVIQCRTSGLTDRQWYQQQGLSFNTFYSWVKRLREAACYEIPEQPKGSRKTTSITEQHEAVRVDIQSPMLKQEIVTSNRKRSDSTPSGIYSCLIKSDRVCTSALWLSSM